VRDPVTRIPVAAMSRERRTRERGALPGGSSDALVDNRLGSGSDYTVFLNHLGIPIADLTFDGPYGVYHSLYDTHRWVAAIGDPGFRYHVALVQMWGTMALRLANADALPLDYEPYARMIETFAGEVERAAIPNLGVEGAAQAFGELRDAVADLRGAASAFNAARDRMLAANDREGLRELNAALLRVERQFVDPDGIPGRPWYRHQIYAPQYTYAPEVLPAIAEAVKAQDRATIVLQTSRAAAAVRRAAGVLRLSHGTD
jgi:N-acetylated-alpha-linked acidic dipeptidase